MGGKKWDGEPDDEVKRVARQSELVLSKLRRDIRWSMMLHGSAFVDVESVRVIDPAVVRRSDGGSGGR